MKSLKLLSTVALLDDVPSHGLVRGEVGTVVEVLGQNAYEVEFNDDMGRAYAIIPLSIDRLILLHNRSKAA
jgi:hypothetical protein